MYTVYMALMIFAPKSSLGKALSYLKEQWPYLLNYLKDGRPELSNNRAERSIKPFVTDRKKFPVRQHPVGCPGQRGDLQPDRDSQGIWVGSLPLSDLDFRNRSNAESYRGGLGRCSWLMRQSLRNYIINPFEAQH